MENLTGISGYVASTLFLFIFRTMFGGSSTRRGRRTGGRHSILS
jgi:hypothetical protein